MPLKFMPLKFMPLKFMPPMYERKLKDNVYKLANAWLDENKIMFDTWGNYWEFEKQSDAALVFALIKFYMQDKNNLI